MKLFGQGGGLKMQNTLTGDVMEWPPPLPDSNGWTQIILNGKPLLRIQCVDGPPARNILEDGTEMTTEETALYMVELLRRSTEAA